MFRQVFLLSVFIFIIVVVLLFANHFVYAGQSDKQMSENISLLDSKAINCLNADIAMESGTLKISDNSNVDTALCATLSYCIPANKPILQSSSVNGTGIINIIQPHNAFLFLKTKEYMSNFWDIKLNNNIQTNLTIKLGSGNADLSLGKLKMSNLTIKNGSGQLHLDFSGKPSIQFLDISYGLGESVIDFSGQWTNNLNANISSGIGSVKLKFPSNVGIKVFVKSGLGKIKTKGFNRVGDSYINNAYGKINTMLVINLKAGSGDIELFSAE